MKTIETTNNCQVAIERSDGELVKVTVSQNADHGFISMGFLVTPHQARRLATVIEHVAQQVMKTADGSRI